MRPAHLCRLAPCVGALVLLAGCGSGTQVVSARTAPSPSPTVATAGAVCAKEAADLGRGYPPAEQPTVIIARSTTKDALQTWLQSPDGGGYPPGPGDRFAALAGRPGDYPVTYCLMRDPELAIPEPPAPGQSAPSRRYEGLGAWVTADGQAVTGPMGDLDRMRQDTANLPGLPAETEGQDPPAGSRDSTSSIKSSGGGDL